MQEELKKIQSQDGATLGYRILRQPGPAPTLVMLHGLASNHTRWSEFVEQTRLSSGWNLLRPDLRGHGYSMCHGAISRAIWCQDLQAMLAAEALDKAVIVGHSLGAQIGIEFAQQYPSLCQALILIDPVFPSLLKGTLGRARRLRGLIWLAVRVLWLLQLFGLGKKQFPQRDMKALDEQTRMLLASEPQENIARLYMNPRADLVFMPLVNYLQDIFEVVRPLKEPHTVTQPVRVLLSAGAELSHTTQTQAQLARFADVQTVDIHADHWPLTEKPDEVREAIEAFCAQWEPH